MLISELVTFVKCTRPLYGEGNPFYFMDLFKARRKEQNGTKRSTYLHQCPTL